MWKLRLVKIQLEQKKTYRLPTNKKQKKKAF